MYVKLQFMPARCLTKWPHEAFGQILEFFLVDLIYIIKEKEWWWWWSFWQRFVRFQIWGYLHIVSKSSLVTSLLVNLVNISTNGQHESCSPSLGLG
jgi:hypothetical protein